jgi:hypothetical protein
LDSGRGSLQKKRPFLFDFKHVVTECTIDKSASKHFRHPRQFIFDPPSENAVCARNMVKALSKYAAFSNEEKDNNNKPI